MQRLFKEGISPVEGSALQGIPKLMVVVDTEEEFDWSRPYSRSAVGVAHVGELGRVQTIFERYGIVPTYVVDYPIATQEEAFGTLRQWQEDCRCEIGAHLHPWVNPPFDEELSVTNSYPGNLPPALEREKLARLTDAIARNFGRRPAIYRAGRYGIGSNTAAILEGLGYLIDSSVVPFTSFVDEGGPDFALLSRDPFWFGASQQVLEIPLTIGWFGVLNAWGGQLQPLLRSRRAIRLHLPGVFSRLGLFERIRLTPEGTSFAELCRLTKTLLAAGTRLFVLSFHSPTVVPGNTPYVRDRPDLQAFLRTIDEYCEFFRTSCGGDSSTLREVRRLLAAKDRSGGDPIMESDPPLVHSASAT